MSIYAYIDAAMVVVVPRDADTPTLGDASHRLGDMCRDMPGISGSEYTVPMTFAVHHDGKRGYKVRVTACGIMRDRSRDDAVRQWRDLAAFLRNKLGSEPEDDYVCITENTNVWFKHQEKRAKKEKRK